MDITKEKIPSLGEHDVHPQSNPGLSTPGLVLEARGKQALVVHGPVFYEEVACGFQHPFTHSLKSHTHEHKHTETHRYSCLGHQHVNVRE